VRERAPGPEDERLDRRLRQLELLGDLAIRQALPLAQEDRAALAVGHPLEHVLEPHQLVRSRRGGGRQLLHDLEVGRRLDPSAPPGRAPAGEADVVSDLEEPGRFLLRDDTAAKAPEGVEERALDRVLGLLAGAELVEAVAEDLVPVALVERLGRRGLGGYEGLDATGAAYGGDGCQNVFLDEAGCRTSPADAVCFRSARRTTDLKVVFRV
jgi:hypothetical protein